MMKLTEMKAQLKDSLKPSRYQHTLGVMESALDLLERFQPQMNPVLTEQAEVAALLHDCAKNMSDETLLNMAKQHGLIQDEWMSRCPQLLHGPVGAILAKKHYGVEDPDVLRAITYHTTGCIEMTFLDKVIFLADYIEPGRCFPGVEDLRNLADQNLDEAVLSAMTNTICHVAQTGGLLHPLTIAARNHLIVEKQNKKSGINPE